MLINNTQTIKQKVPELRFAEFSGEWEEKKLSELFDFGKTNSLSRDKLNYKEGEVYNIHYGDIHTKFRSFFRLENENVPRVTDNYYTNNSTLLTTGDIVMADASEDYEDIGKTIEIISTNNKKLIAGLHTIVGVKKSNRESLGFFAYLMESERQKLRIKKIAQGVKVLGLPKKYIENLILKIPLEKEQKKISLFLSSVHEWIENSRKQKEELEKYKKGMMQKIFSQEIRFKDDNEEDFPEWEVKTLKSMLGLVVDNRGKTPPTKSSGIPLVEVNALGNKYLDYSATTKYVDKNTYKEWFRTHIQPGDILFTTVGKTALCSYYLGEKKATIAQNIVGLRFEKEIPNFMFYLLTEKHNSHKFKRIEMGAVQPSVKVSQMVKIKFLVPSDEEQLKIAEFLSSLDNLIDLKQKQITEAEKWKKGLMQRMFV